MMKVEEPQGQQNSMTTQGISLGTGDFFGGDRHPLRVEPVPECRASPRV